VPDKIKIIKSILGLRHRYSQALGGCVFKHWRRLDVPVAQLKSLFIILFRQRVNYHTLAEDLKVTPGNVTGIVERLVEQGLVIRKPDPEDRRIIWLEGSEKGRELFTNLLETGTQSFGLILEKMSQDELICFEKGLSGFIVAVEKYLQEQPVNISVKEQ
jgi:MarR family transcriptional regulator, organic hydroperoxide resistance regulator